METSTPYTFNPTSDGNIEVFNNGSRISTGTADAATKQYGYVAPAKPVSTPQLIVTSSQSRTQYNDNVNKLNGVTSSLQPTVTPDNKGKISATPNNGLQPTKNYSVDAKGNIVSADGSLVAGKDANGGYSSVSNAQGKVLTGVDAQGNLMFGDAPTGTPANGTDPTGTGTGADTGNGDVKVPTTDPVLAKQYNDVTKGLDDAITSAKSNLEQAKATLLNDPAATSAVNQIMQKYDVLIQQMKDKNSILLGGYAKNGARTGMMQYANDMYSSFMSAEMDKANQRIADLITTETQLVLKAQLAYKTGDVKALDAATKAYDAANKAKLDAINKLLTSTNNQVKTVQAQQKIDAAQAKQQVSDDIRISTSLGKTIADTIKNSGVTDPAEIDKYIQGMADKAGITNVDILKSSVTKATQDQQKLDSQLANTASIIKKRNTTGTGGGTAGTLKTADLNKLGNTLQTGGTFSGVKYNGIGEDGKFDPNLYNATYIGLKTKVGVAAAQQFLVKYPPEKVLNLDNANNPEIVLEPEIVNRIKAKANTAKAGGGFH